VKFALCKEIIRKTILQAIVPPISVQNSFFARLEATLGVVGVEGGSFIPGNGKKFGERVPWYSHFLETLRPTVKQHHRCQIPHIGY